MTTTKREVHYTPENTWTIPQIIAEFGVSRKSIKRCVDEGRFPSPVKWNSDLGSRRMSRYDRTEVTKVLGNFNPKRGELVYHTVEFNKGELELIRKASTLLYLNPQEYMIRVLTEHAKRVLNFTYQQELDKF